MEVKNWALVNTIIDEADIHQLNAATIKVTITEPEFHTFRYGNLDVSFPGRQQVIRITTHSPQQETFIKLKFGSNVFLISAKIE